MCLRTTQKKPLKATSDIVCYKKLRLNQSALTTKHQLVIVKGDVASIPTGTARYSLHAAHRGTKYLLGKVYKTTFNPRDVNPLTFNKAINRGFHAFMGTVASVKKREGERIFECIVPKGTRYFLGSNNGESKGICAESIVVVKPV